MLFPSEVAAKGDFYLGKEVAVRGYVKKVCCSGNKCFLADDDEAEKTLTMMANEETGKYNKELKGKSVKFVGEVKENRITKEMIAESEAKQAEEAAKSNHNCDNGQAEKKEEKGQDHKHCSKGQGVPPLTILKHIPQMYFPTIMVYTSLIKKIGRP